MAGKGTHASAQRPAQEAGWRENRRNQSKGTKEKGEGRAHNRCLRPRTGAMQPGQVGDLVVCGKNPRDGKRWLRASLGEILVAWSTSPAPLLCSILWYT
jgi:hypothetical protein